MDQELNHLVFVYGTLKTGEPNYDVVINNPAKGKSKLVGVAKTVKAWPLVIGSRFNIPFLLYKENVGKQVLGEVYHVDDLMLASLDELECHPKYYERICEEVIIVKAEADLENKIGETCKPWMYFLRNYRSFLLDLPFIDDYSSDGPHGLKYVSRYARKPASSFHEDVIKE